MLIDSLLQSGKYVWGKSNPSQVPLRSWVCSICVSSERHTTLLQTLDTGDPGSHPSQAPSQVLSLEKEAGGAGLGPHPWHLMPA